MTRSRSAVALAALLLLACAGDQISGPVDRRSPGRIELRLTMPRSGNGALLVTLHGGPIDSVTSPDLDLATLESAAAEYHVLVRGKLRAGAIVRLWVPDSAVAYGATIEQATDGHQRADTTGYALVAALGRP